MGPHATAAHQQQLNEDNRQALVLFGIVFIFFFSNVPRILLNLHEVNIGNLGYVLLLCIENYVNIMAYCCGLLTLARTI